MICVSNLFIACAFYALLPTLPLYLKGWLHFADGSIGLIIACFSITGILVRPFAGYVLDNQSRYLVFLFSYFAVTLLFGGYAITTAAAGFVVIRLLHGAAWGATTSASATLINDLVPHNRRGEGVGIFTMTMPLGMAIGPSAADAVMAEWGPIFLFWSLVAFSSIGLAVCLFAGRYRRKIVRTPHVSVRSMSWERMIFAPAIPKSTAMCLLMIPYGGVMVFSSLYAQHYELGNIGLFFLIFSASIIVSRLLLGRAFDRGHLWGPVLMGYGFIVAGIVILATAVCPWQFYFSAFSIGFGYGVIMPTFQAMVNNLAKPQRRGVANATYLVSYDLGIGLGGLITGLALEYVGYRTVYLCSIALVLCSLVVAAAWSVPHYKNNEVADSAAERIRT